MPVLVLFETGHVLPTVPDLGFEFQILQSPPIRPDIRRCDHRAFMKDMLGGIVEIDILYADRKDHGDFPGLYVPEIVGNDIDFLEPDPSYIGSVTDTFAQNPIPHPAITVFRVEIIEDGMNNEIGRILIDLPADTSLDAGNEGFFLKLPHLLVRKEGDGFVPIVPLWQRQSSSIGTQDFLRVGL